MRKLSRFFGILTGSLLGIAISVSVTPDVALAGNAKDQTKCDSPGSYTFTTLDVLGAFSTDALKINARGQIVGNFLDSTGKQHEFLKDGERFKTIDASFTDAVDTTLSGINARGEIVGYYPYDPTAAVKRGFLYDRGRFTRIDFPGVSRSGALGINALGQIVGFYYDNTGALHGYLYDDGVYATI